MLCIGVVLHSTLDPGKTICSSIRTFRGSQPQKATAAIINKVEFLLITKIPMIKLNSLCIKLGIKCLNDKELKIPAGVLYHHEAAYSSTGHLTR